MLRIIHTGRAYEVLDLLPTTYCFPDNRGLLELRDRYGALRTRHWQQSAELEKACRAIGDLEALVEILQAAWFNCMEITLGKYIWPHQREELESHESQDPR